jgi:hypothetical protein
MKQKQTKLVDVGPQTDINALLNDNGRYGWTFAHIIATPIGAKFMLIRELDVDVTAADLAQEAKEEHEAELMKQFAPGPGNTVGRLTL